MAYSKSRGSSRRRQTIWVRSSYTLTTDAAGYVAVDVLADLAQVTAGVVTTPALLGSTITRIRGMIGTNDTTVSGIGILAFKVLDNAGPVAADAPSLAANREDSWMGWVPFGYDLASKDAQFTEFDIRAQRRMDELGMKLYGIVDLSAAAGVNTVAIVTSVLVTLP